MAITIPVSAGELADRVTILRLKKARIADPEKLANVTEELAGLEEIFEREVSLLGDVPPEFHQLADVNQRLWDIEDVLRGHEAAGDFGTAFVEAARQVYRLNDERFRLKRVISERCGSELVEEKAYRDP